MQPPTEFLLQRTINTRNENLLNEVDDELKLKTTNYYDVTLWDAQHYALHYALHDAYGTMRGL